MPTYQGEENDYFFEEKYKVKEGVMKRLQWNVFQTLLNGRSQYSNDFSSKKVTKYFHRQKKEKNTVFPSLFWRKKIQFFRWPCVVVLNSCSIKEDSFFDRLCKSFKQLRNLLVNSFSDGKNAQCIICSIWRVLCLLLLKGFLVMSRQRCY